MSRDLGDAIGSTLGHAARDVVKTVASNVGKNSRGPLSGVKGVAAGAGLAVLAPLAGKGIQKVVRARGEADDGGLKSLSGDSKGEAPAGVGKGRRLPVQQAVDVAVPIDTAYNQWTQFEKWPEFMHRLQAVSQEDETHVAFKTKIWGISKEFEAEIVEQRPDERIKWRVTKGMTHAGVVTFHKLSDRLTRIEVTLDVEPGSPLEKAARGMRHIKRAVRADLARFKAYVEMEEEETGAWRGTVDDGEVKKQRRSSSGGSRNGRSQAASRSRSRSGTSSSRGGSSSSRSRSASSRSRSSNGSGSRSGSSSGSRSGSSSGSRSGSSSGSRSSGSKSGNSSRSRSSSRKTTARRGSSSRS
jgi:uncharacterized membrane protein